MASMARPRRVLCRVPGATYRDRRNTRNGKKCSPLEPATPLLRSFARVCARAVDASIRTKYVLASMKGSVQVCVCVCGAGALLDPQCLTLSAGGGICIWHEPRAEVRQRASPSVCTAGLQVSAGCGPEARNYLSLGNLDRLARARRELCTARALHAQREWCK